MDRRSGPCVLILASDRSVASRLGSQLDAHGWTTVTPHDAETALAAIESSTFDAAILASPGSQDDARTAAMLKTVATARITPILALGDVATVAVGGPAFDLVLPPDSPPRQIAARLASLVRLAVAEEEAQVRAITCAERGGSPIPRSPPTPLQVLTVGEPASRFLALSHALAQLDLQTTAAFTAYTAFDYMHDRAFDAVVLWVGESHAEAASIAGGMRRNARLHNVPALLYVRPGTFVDTEEAYARGFSDVLSAIVTPAEAAFRIKALAAETRREIMIRRSLDLAGAGLLDPATGLFPPSLFAFHLTAVARSLHHRRRPLSVAVLRGGAQPRLDQARAGGWLARASPQIDAMVARLVRAADSAARLGPDTLGIAFPAATPPQAAAAAERVAAVIACTAFPAGDGAAPFTTHFKIGVAQIDAQTSPSMALDRAARLAAAKAAA